MEDLIYDKNNSFGNDINIRFARNRIKKTQKILRGIIKNNKIKNCLDIGTGTGYFLDFIKKLSPSIECFGIDISAKAIAIARNNYNDINFSQEEIASFAKNGKKFDLILSLENIEHIYNLDEYLAIVSKLLNKNGILLVSTPNLNSYLNRFLILFGMIPRFQEYFLFDNVPIFSIGGRDFPSNPPPPSGHIRILNCTVLDYIAKKFKFKIIARYGAGLFGHKKILGSIDLFFSFFPHLANCLIYVYKK
ncbi:MAG: class I SAM-dependent methyltransferase [Candidatus Buchananbacteria bacterium]